MKNYLLFLIFGLFPAICIAQSEFQYIKDGDLKVFYIDSAVYSENTSVIRLDNQNIMTTGFYRNDDKNRISCVLLFSPDGKLLPNAYETNFLAFYLHDDKESMTVDLANAPGGGAYLLGTTAKSDYYTGYLARLSSAAEIDEGFSVPGTTDTGFISIQNYNIAEPGQEDQFQDLNDTLYTEPRKLLVQPDGKLLVVAASRKKNTENRYEDGESCVIRLLPNGTVDKSFGFEGIAHVNLSEGCDDVATAALNSKGEILLFGKYNHAYQNGIVDPADQLFVAKLTPSGSIDRRFGDNGEYIFQYPDGRLRPVKMLVRDDLSMLFFSNIEIRKADDSYNYGLNIFKLDADGMLDTKFQQEGTENIYKMGIGFANDVLHTADDKYIVVGTNQNLLKDHHEDVEILFTPNGPRQSGDKVYTQDELNAQGAIGFTMRLDAACNIDSTFPKDGLFFTSYQDLTKQIYFSNLLADNSQLTIFGAGQSEEMGERKGFLVQRILLDLKLGEISCKKDLGLSFYPNPIKEKVSLEFDLCRQEPVSIFLYNINGQLVQTFYQDKMLPKGHQKETLSINNNLAAGAYVLQVRAGSASKSVKVIIE